jgi:protein-disulfide isomerase
MKPEERGTAFMMGVMTACAVTVTGILLYQQFSPPPPPTPATLTLDRDPVDGWERFVSAGHRIGPDTAAITIVAFSDFECPFCRHFAASLWPAVRQHFPAQVTLVYRHFPLSIHQHAKPAALAAECAAVQGRFEPFHDALFAAQGALGTVPWSSLAIQAGVPDTASFIRCLGAPETVDAVNRGLRAARELGATGTPTLLINGRLLRGAPDSAVFHQIISDALADGN